VNRTLEAASRGLSALGFLVILIFAILVMDSLTQKNLEKNTEFIQFRCRGNQGRWS